MTELLTPAEHDAVAQAGELWNALCGIVADGPARDGDLAELIFHVHAIQRAVLKQAAARAYPDLYRLLGGDPVEPAPSYVATTVRCSGCADEIDPPPPPPPEFYEPPLIDPTVPDWTPRPRCSLCGARRHWLFGICFGAPT